jgi:small subunit ribosomal protein S9
MPTTPAKKVLVVSGKRKTAVARAIIKQGSGKVRINMTPVEITHQILQKQKSWSHSASRRNVWNQLDKDVKTSGGGYMGQAEAARMAIANGILKWTKSTHLRTVFSEYDRTMVAGDSRSKETKKVGGAGARSKEQKSYR